MEIEVRYAEKKFFESFHRTLDIVARERQYIEMIEAPPLENTVRFQEDMVAKKAPSYYALDGDRVVGWCDISWSENPRMRHRGGLGMGLLPAYRGKGLGYRLMAAALTHARGCKLEKIELSVYATNLPAIALYKKCGFEQEGYVKHYRKLDGRYFDCLNMGLFL